MNFYYEKDGIKAINEFIDTQKPSQVIVLTDDNTQKYCLPTLKQQIKHKFTNVNIKDGDVNKNLEALSSIWQHLLELGVDRKALMINLGGGVVTDIGGFAAVTFKRGIDFINVPTTLLGMVDAAIGGKNGINFKDAKNQIGTIVQPSFIWINSEFLTSLPKDEFMSGFAEMLKHGLISDAQYWQDLVAYSRNNDMEILPDLIKASVQIKQNIVEIDPNEKSVRKILNFGHTLGHAIESYMNYQQENKISHGYAVAIGMILGAYLSYKNENFKITDVNTIKDVILKNYPLINFDNPAIEKIIDLLKYDKKNENGKVQFVLLSEIGKAVYNKEVSLNDIKEAFEYYLS